MAWHKTGKKTLTLVRVMFLYVTNCEITEISVTQKTQILVWWWLNYTFNLINFTLDYVNLSAHLHTLTWWWYNHCYQRVVHPELKSICIYFFQQMWVFDEEIGMNQREITYVPGLYKIFDEILGEWIHTVNSSSFSALICTVNTTIDSLYSWDVEGLLSL